jgi:RHS repeat-associated protein
MDRVATRTDPLIKSESFTYDNAGNPATHTDRKSQVTQRTYDALDRLSQVTYQDTSTTTYTWDAGNRLTQTVDSISGTITRSYDGLDRLTQEGTPNGTVNYTYDAASRRATMTVLGQPTVTYTYDNADRLTQISQGTSTVGVGYDTAGRRTSLTLPSGVVTEYAYDGASRLTGLTYKNGQTTLGALTYTYDAAGNRESVGGTWARTMLPEPVSSASYNANNQQVAFGGQTQTFDLNGNLTSDGATTYTWDARNRLISLSGPGLTASFQYDPLGRRTQKTIDGTATGFHYDGLSPVQELNGAAVVANLLTGLGIDENFMRTDAGGAQNFLTDALGSTVAELDAAVAIQAEHTYEPFGATTSMGATGNAFQYTGRENDATGLYYYRARYYHPARARFIAEDPIEFAGGDENLYGYVGNDPLGLVDPLGLYGWENFVSDAATFSAGFGDTMSFSLTNKVRDWMGTNGVVDKCSGLYSAGGWTGVGVGAFIGGSGLARGGLRPELGNWKQGGKWFFPEGTRGPHFHFGNGPGLQSHHLPWQAGNWAKNFANLARQGKASEDIKNIGLAAYGGAVVASGTLAGRACGCER